MKILINQLKNIGDVLLATTAIALVKKVYPDAWITLMTVPRVAPFFENHPLIDEVLPFAYKSKGTSLSSMIDLISEIRKRKFDVNISLDSRLRPLLIAYLAGIPIRVAGDGMDGHGKEWYRILFTQMVPITQQITEHQSETFMKVVRPFLRLSAGETARPTMPRPSESSKLKIKNLLGIQHDSANRKKILFCVRGTSEDKNWQPDYFVQVINETKMRYDADCYIIGTAGDFTYAQAIIDKCNAKVENICGQTEPADLVALFMESDLLVSVDTGSVHIAATTDIPIIAIYLVTNPVEWRPLSENATEICEDYAFKRDGVEPTEDFIIHEKILPAHVMREIEREINIIVKVKM
ncbi:MAG: glycosyltransferase family 9 protein [Acidaminococcaceae bacterium]